MLTVQHCDRSRRCVNDSSKRTDIISGAEVYSTYSRPTVSPRSRARGPKWIEPIVPEFELELPSWLTASSTGAAHGARSRGGESA